jgi:hypothetical protein
VITTHALFALKVQRKVSNGVAGLPPADHLLIERDRGQFVRYSDAARWLRTLRIPALQLKREWSPWPQFGSDPGNPRELSKG